MEFPERAIMMRSPGATSTIKALATILLVVSLVACGQGSSDPAAASSATSSSPSNSTGGSSSKTGSSSSGGSSTSGGSTTATTSTSFSASSYSATQSQGSVSVTVSVAGTPSGAASVSYATADGTAVAGTDYTATSGTLQWAASDGSAQTISIPISDAKAFSGTKSFTVSLSAASGTTLASPSSATVTITGSAGQTGAPSAPGNLTLVNQGGPNNDNSGDTANSRSDYQAVQWTAASAGAYPINYYQVYRNGSAYATVSAATAFKGYISGTTLTVTSVTSGSIIPGPRWSGNGLAAGTMIDEAQLSGTPGAAGTYHVNVSQSVGSAGSPVTFSAWVFIDTAATASNDPNTATQANSYAYSVSAVDTQGEEGSQTTQYSAWGYQNGYSNWSQMNFDYAGAISTYNSTAGNPQGGLYDLKANLLAGGGINPVAAAPQAPLFDLEIGAFNYYTVQINPGPTVGYQLFLSHLSRLPPGDVYGWNGVNDVFAYGPAPVANTWATYKIPLSALGIGRCTITASISGTTLTVTSVNSGPAIVDAGGYVTGPGIPAGTYISAYGQAGAIGTFTLAGPGISSSTRVASETMSYARTAFYKSTIQPSANVVFYMNNMGWTEK